MTTPVPVLVSLAVVLTVAAAASARTAAAPKNTSPPTTMGSAQQGQILLAGPGAWDNSPSQFAYQWERCGANGTECTDIPNANRGKYTLTAADAGHVVRVKVTASNLDGSTSSPSAPTAAVVALAATTNKAPTIDFLSLERVGTRVYARFRVCDDSGKAVAITERDTKAGALAYTRRFSVTPLPCTTQSPSWLPAARFRTHGRYAVTLRAADIFGALSRPVSRSLAF
jgi:hypothetical protein